MRTRKIRNPLVLVILLIAALLGYKGFAPHSEHRHTVESNATGTKTPPPEGLYRVTWVVDGDTIHVAPLDENSKEEYKIRYIGVDTPEMSDKGWRGDLARRAKKINMDLVFEKKVLLEYDRSPFDKYHRVLAYVFLTDDNGQKTLWINEELVRRGLAFAKAYPPNTSRASELKAAEQDARSNNLGIWKYAEQ